MRLNWAWLMTILDSTEAQLRFGSALSSASETGIKLDKNMFGSAAILQLRYVRLR